MDWLQDPQVWVALGTLTLLEVVLGIDNIVFISIISSKLPQQQQPRARRTGLGAALVMRVMLLLGLAWVVKLDKPFWTLSILGHELPLSGKALILLLGGLFLIGKSTYEIHEKLEGDDGEVTRRIAPSFAAVIVQIMLLDLVFSLDSVITAVGMVNQIAVMVAAVVIAMAVMLLFVNQISEFVDRHPTIKMLALSFLILIGVMLVAEGVGHHIPKGYIYFAMGFSVFVEALNMRVRKPGRNVTLHQPYR